jgi:hypothetical protein
VFSTSSASLQTFDFGYRLDVIVEASFTGVAILYAALWIQNRNW